MAFRRPFRSFRRRSFGRRLEKPRWTAVSSDINPLAAGAASSVILVNPEAMLTTGTLATTEQEFKVVRLVGHVTTRLTLATEVTGASIGLGILKTQVTTVTLGGFQDPLIPGQLVQRDWLRVMNHDVPAAGGSNGFSLRQEFDIKVQRNLKSNDIILLAASNLAGGDDVIITIDVRILIVIRA